MATTASDFGKKHQAKGREDDEGALLAVLESRGLRISNKARTRIVVCTDIAPLDAWVRRAASVTSVAELFLSSPPPPVGPRYPSLSSLYPFAATSSQRAR